MANNYTYATVTPNFPASFVTALEKGLLSDLGFTCEGKDNLYFYSENGMCYDLTDSDCELEDYEAVITDQDRELYLEDDDFNRKINADQIFQNLLVRNNLNEVLIEGAFTCDKMRPGEFGGFVTLIKSDAIYTENTYSLADRLRAEHNRK